MDGTQFYPWPGGQRLVADMGAWLDLSGRSVIDLGCGTGIVARAALNLGAAKVWALDAEPRIDFRDDRLEVLTHHWGDPTPIQAEIVLGGDVTYKPPLFPLLLRSICTALNSSGIGLLGDPRSQIEPELSALAAYLGLRLAIRQRPGPYSLILLQHATADPHALFDTGSIAD